MPHTVPLAGVYPILATPFRADGGPDEPDLARVIDFIVAAHADGIVFPGVASEVETLAPNERRRLVDVVARRVASRIPLVIGVSAADAATAEALAVHAKSVGAVALMAVAPAAFKSNSGAITDYYARIAAAGVPIILQNAPPPAGCALSPDEVIAIVRGNPGIRYVKEESLPCGQRITQLLAARVPHLAGVFGGAGGRYLTDELARGACGTMPACELIDLHVRQFAMHRAGDADGVRYLFNRMLPLLNFQAVFRMAMTKEVLRRRGVISATHVRAAGPRFDAGDLLELDSLLADVADLMPLPASAARDA
ncbi:MAG: dihydrodipicolinate synthase family protein [Betaproteobacteria bacterium]